MTESRDEREGRPADEAKRPDAWARVEYRRLIAWGPRIEREAPFLLRMLDQAPERSVLDVGCGTGEHTAFFAEKGCRAVGLDASAAMIEKAREHETRGHGRFVEGDVLEARRVLSDEEPFGMAICLGNMLPHLLEDDAVRVFARNLSDLLLPSGILVVQLLNYHPVLAEDVRHLPLNFRPREDGGELVFLRLMKRGRGRRVLFFPTTLEWHPEEEETPVTLVSTRRVELAAWTDRDLVPIFREAGFAVETKGDMQGGPFDPRASKDLVLIARRTSS